MNLSKLIGVSVLALAAMTTGCGDKCKSLCEDEKDCSNIPAEEKPTGDCGDYCDKDEKRADKFGCSSQRDDLLDCADDVDDVCKDQDTKCEKEVSAYASCYVKYCTAHSTDSDCS